MGRLLLSSEANGTLTKLKAICFGKINEKVYDKICKKAENLVNVCENISNKYGIPIINKRISVTPISIISSYLPILPPYALCPPIEEFLSIVVPPSLKFIPLKGTKLPSI